MSGYEQLTRVDEEFRLLLLEGNHQEVATAITSWAEAGLTTRVVRGRKMRTLQALFDEFAAALQFPIYFGENRDAFDECIADLEGLRPASGFVVVITELDQVLDHSDADLLRWLVGSLVGAAAGWAQPVELGEWWDRPAVAFHVVLAGEPARLADGERRWSAAGASFARLS
ncbi:barstar family protein [Agromyces sp. ISL-38]|uniref:barstar family protein n=1 Tax=Agromyces sp. ISL-38 TaxID=2819107 RepID=UPI001BE4E897|nr:barstar family protein [Agromyces sp. ISL-38]MBT2499561.1 barstar family protein [Agromyces sp. ISL-38]